MHSNTFFFTCYAYSWWVHSQRNKNTEREMMKKTIKEIGKELKEIEMISKLLDLGMIKTARGLVMKVIQRDKERIKKLSEIEVTPEDKEWLFDELNEFQAMYHATKRR